MINFRQETLDKLKAHNKDLSDIDWVGNYDTRVDIEEFLKTADLVYDDGYGATFIDSDLLIVGKDWWLERHEYDGAEDWVFKQLPIKPKDLGCCEVIPTISKKSHYFKIKKERLNDNTITN